MSKRRSHLAGRIRFGATAAVALMIVVLATPGFAAAAPPVLQALAPTCGQAIVVNTTVTADLINCPADGLVVAADNIVLNLNGHTVDGDGTPGDSRVDAGVRIVGHHDVRVLGGTLTEFDSGVLLDGSTQNRVDGVTVIRSGGRGIQVLNASHGNVIVNSTSTLNGRSGIALFDSGSNVIQNNVTSSNGAAGIFDAGPGSNQIVSNQVVNNVEVGLSLSSGNLIWRNRISGNADDVIVGGDGNSIVGNVVTDASGCGDGCGFGISIEGGTGNFVAGNVVSRTARDGIRVDAFEDFGGTSIFSTTIRDNFVRDATHDGIAVGTDPDGSGTIAGTVIAGNLATRSGNDGIHVDTAETTIAGNIAVNNDNLGIEAVPGVTDGGGNHAAGNGNPAQCTGVVCA